MRKDAHFYYDTIVDKELINFINDKSNWKGCNSKSSFILSLLYKAIYESQNSGNNINRNIPSVNNSSVKKNEVQKNSINNNFLKSMSKVIND